MKSSQTCSICASVNREAIESAIAARVPYRQICAQFQTSAATLSRHKSHAGPAGEPTETPTGILEAADAAIQELRVLGRRARKHKDRIKGVTLALSVSRELRAWLSLRSQLKRRIPTISIEPAETEVGEADLERLAKVYLKRHGDKEKLN